MRGYFEIGIYDPKYGKNIGTLWRSAYQLGANGIFTIKRRYSEESSDTTKSWRHIPLRHFADFPSFLQSLPKDASLIAVEQHGKPLEGFSHPERCLYLLGREDAGLPTHIAEKCHARISLSSLRENSFNVSVAGSILMYHRMIQKKGGKAFV